MSCLMSCAREASAIPTMGVEYVDGSKVFETASSSRCAGFVVMSDRDCKRECICESRLLLRQLEACGVRRRYAQRAWLSESVRFGVHNRRAHWLCHHELAYNDGDQTAYAFVCNADGSGCGIDGDPNIECMAEAQTRDPNEGTFLDDGARGFTARNPSIGEEMGDVPMDEDANYISTVYRIRVVCRHYT